MNTNIILPMEIVNKILIMRPSHPIVTILREYTNNHLGPYNDGNTFYCEEIYFRLQNNDCFMLECLDYKYKSYRRVYNKVINSIKYKILYYNFYKELCDDKQLNHEEYNFKNLKKVIFVKTFGTFKNI